MQCSVSGRISGTGVIERIGETTASPCSEGIAAGSGEKDGWGQLANETRTELKRIKTELQREQVRKDNALTLLLDSAIEADDYSKLKKQSERKIFELERELEELSHRTDISPHIADCIDVLENLPALYLKSDGEGKRRILCSMFSEKLEFVENGFRTLPLNEAMRLICSVGKDFREIKMGQEAEFCNLSHQVIPLGLEPRAHTLKVYCSTN